MNQFEEQLSNRLKKDASAYKEWSASRFDTSNNELLWNPPKRRFWKPAALAASVLLATVLWLTYPNQEPKGMMDVSTVATQWQQMPAKIEQATQSPLQQEQEAIKADLKALKDQLFTI